MSKSGGSSSAVAEAKRKAQAEASDNGGIPAASGGIVGQDLDASRVRMDVYFDFTCPACRAVEQTQSATVDSLGTQGVVDVYHHPLGDLDAYWQASEYSTRSASAAAPGDGEVHARRQTWVPFCGASARTLAWRNW
ncbi:DsbA family protein [Demequina sp.]|uniref:DsbA family protein n=1 Tax=Demequina sp. TaxID=2050685 RepID=UPI0025BEE4F8|nr:DsbA family protein [Demequina sp.]